MPSTPPRDAERDLSTASAAERRPGIRGWAPPLRWLTYVAGVLVLALVAGLITAVVVVRRPYPDTTGSTELPGLRAEVEVVRDGHGIAQVYADTSEDLFYAQGYVHAQDRFFEMDFRRHVTAGRVSELLGEEALKADMFTRTMGWRRVAEQELSLLSPETLDLLESYAAGVNAYLERHSPGQLALEYSLLAATGLDYTPEPWTPADSVAWLKAMAWDLRGNMEEEIERAVLSASLPAERIDELWPDYPFGRHEPIVTEGAVVDDVYEQGASGGDSRKPARPGLPRAAVAALRSLREDVADIPELLGRGPGVGSNSWVVSGDRSTTGLPLLANDPHLDISVPGVWHQMGLHCREVTEACPYDVSGFTFSGMPGVVIGHNADVAWGITNLGPDVTDLYLEKVVGQGTVYDGRLRPMGRRDETIDVRGREEPFRFTVRSTVHGPLLSDVSDELSTVGANADVGAEAPEQDNGYAVALAWTALTPNRTADAVFALNRASDWDEFRDAARLFAAPAQNLVYADREGHIGYQAPGMVPIRRSGTSGDYPSEGWDSAHDWTGSFVPFDALPSVLDPEDGVVVTANQAVAGRDYPYYLADTWSYGYRSERIRELIERRAKLSVADMAQIQLDDRHGFAPTFVPYLLDLVLPSEYLASGQRVLERWNYEQSSDSAAAAFYNAVWKHTLQLTFGDEMKATLWPDGGDRWFEVLRRLLADPGSSWWDDVDTETAVEDRDAILAAAMQLARDEMTRRQAVRAEEWTWGHHHRLNLENAPLGQSGVGVVEWLFNRGGYEVAGGDDVVNATKWDAATDDFTVTAAPSMRMVVSLQDFDDSRWINLTGVSGHPFHPHYVDQTELWVAGETLPWAYSRAAVEDTADDTLVLTPAGG